MLFGYTDRSVCGVSAGICYGIVLEHLIHELLPYGNDRR